MRRKTKQEKAESKHKYYLAHRAEAIARSIQYQKDNPDKIREKNKRYQERHPEKGRERQRRYRERHLEIVNERTRMRRKAYPYKQVAIDTRRNFKQAFANLKIENGWPDASRLEVKIGTDRLKDTQLKRFAWLERFHGIQIAIQTAATHEDLQFRGKSYRRFSSVAKYLAFLSPDLVPLWNQLCDAIQG
jgi:hypothetical protein